MRQSHYMRRAVNTETGADITSKCEFTELHARAVGTSLEYGDIPETAALRLINRWNLMGQEHATIRYTYWLH